MLFVAVGITIGIVIGILVVRFVPENAIGWVVVGLGSMALVFAIAGLVVISIPDDTMFSPAFLTIPLGVGCVFSGFDAVRKNCFTWQVWFGLGLVLILGSIPVLFMLALAIREILYSH